MTPAEFKKKWSRYHGKETAAYQEHFNDLCRLLNQETPAQADSSGNDWFCFQKRVVKDLELFAVEEAGEESAESERGFADVWLKDRFAWEYKGKRKNLDEAYRQLLRYRESLLNPPLLVVCDFDRFIVRTNFNGTVQETHEFTNDQIDRPENLHLLRALFENPDSLRPQRTTAQVTEQMARQIAELARLIQERESIELADARTRKEIRVAQKKNLRIARFLNRIVFCLFAEDTGLLPPKLFSEILNSSIRDPRQFTEAVEQLFRVMSKGGHYGHHRLRYFNGHLFEDSTVFELTEDEIAKLAKAAEADWQFIEPSIMGNLFERGLDPDQRAQLGAHYTSEVDIRTLVEPVLMAPLRREWMKLKGDLAPKAKPGRAKPDDRKRLSVFLKKLSAMTVLDPACGSGNFLYVALHLLLDLEKEVISFATLLGFRFEPGVTVQQLRALELNAYAFELAQVSVQIGFLQWRRDNGFDNDRSPVLQNLELFQNEDALLVAHFHNKAKTLKEAQASEHTSDNALRFYTERDWPKCDVIVGNPPFLGTKKLRAELGDTYVEELFRIYADRIPNFSDLCCYWFEKAREQIEKGNCSRAGLLATQGIRGGLNREVLKNIQRTGNIFFAESDRPWILAGANVHVSMVGFDGGQEKTRFLDGKAVAVINSNLTSAADTTKAIKLRSNEDIGFIADVKAGKFDLPEQLALAMISAPNPNGRPNSDVLRPWVNSLDILRRPRDFWIIDYGSDTPYEIAARYEVPYAKIREVVYPKRSKVKRKTYREYWWIHAEPCDEMRQLIQPLPRFLVTPTVSKHRVFAWLSSPTLPDHQLVAFGRDDDSFFGLLHSRFHEIWARAQGTQLREKESGFRYTPTTCFENFPFPHASPLHLTAIAAAAKELNELRERWLNPPEWTAIQTLEFPGSVNGPWSRLVDMTGVHAESGVGTIHYPRLRPRNSDCAAKLKKRTLTSLYNDRPEWLDLAHKRLDATVAAAYGWPTDISDEDIISRLLALNLQRAAEETKVAAAEARKTGPKKPQRQKHDDEML